MHLESKKLNLSIVIPVYNEIKYLKRFTQNLTDAFKNENVEYIFVNDGSEDGSEEWLSNYIKEIKNKNITNFKYINLNKNKGKGFALRKGSKISTGDYILYQDSDLELDPRDSLEMYKNCTSLLCWENEIFIYRPYLLLYSLIK